MYKYLLPTAAIILGVGLYAYAQTYTGPPNPTAAVCAYNSGGPPTPVAGSFYYIQCDSQGRIIVE